MMQVTVFHLFHFVLNHIENEAGNPLRFLLLIIMYTCSFFLPSCFYHAIIPAFYGSNSLRGYHETIISSIYRTVIM